MTCENSLYERCCEGLVTPLLTVGFRSYGHAEGTNWKTGAQSACWNGICGWRGWFRCPPRTAFATAHAFE